MTNNITATAPAADQVWVLTRNGLRIRADQLVGIGFEEAKLYDGSDTPPYRVYGCVAYDSEATPTLARVADEETANECARKIVHLLAHDRRGYGVLQVGRHTGTVSISRPTPSKKPDQDEISSP